MRKNVISLVALFISLFLCLFLLVKVVPKDVSQLASLGAPLPFASRLIINISSLVRSYFIFLAPLILLGMCFCSIYTFLGKKKVFVVNISLTILFLFVSLVIYRGVELPLKRIYRTLSP